MKVGKQMPKLLMAGMVFGLGSIWSGSAFSSPLDPRPMVPPPIDKDLLAITAAAPGYCESVGGSTAYEAISSVTVTQNASGTYMIDTDVYISNPAGCKAGEPCPSYDPNPEQVNIWVDFNGDKQWDASEKVHDAALTGYAGINFYGTMTTIAQFTPPANVTAEPTWLRANLGWGSDPNDPCQYSWTYGNVVDKQVQFEAPKINSISAKGIGTNGDFPQTGKEVELVAEIELPEGYEITKCGWTGDLKVGEGDKDDNCRFKYSPATGPGPKKETYGEKKVKLNLQYTHTESGASGNIAKDAIFNVLFGRDANDTLAQSGPNWFRYWYENQAVPGFSNDIKYDSTASAGGWSPSGGLQLGPRAAKDWPVINIPVKTNCPGGKFGGQKGIDLAAATIAHERTHEDLYNKWNGAGNIWTVGVTLDSDDPTPDKKDDFKGDWLPDDYEDSKTKTDKTKLDSCDMVSATGSDGYQWYGDNELQCYLAEVGKVGVAEKDWANPGKRTEAPAAKSVNHLSEREAASTLLKLRTTSGGIDSSSLPDEVLVSASPDAFAALTGSYSAKGVDTDSDGKYDRLDLNVGLEVVDSGYYNIVAWLQDPASNNVAWANLQQTFSAGTYNIVLPFDGKVIAEAGRNGPFAVAKIEVQFSPSAKLVESAENVYTTPAFFATDFDPPFATLTGPYEDQGVDTNSDGLFETLNIRVGFSVDKPGYYQVTGELEDSTGTPIDTTSAAATFTKGNQQVTLAFSGDAIFSSRQTGPYHLKRLRIEDAEGNRIGLLDAPYQTKAYSYTDFQHAGLWLDNAVVDQGLDLDGDGLFEYLRVSLPLAGNQAGVYLVSADLGVGESTTITGAEAQASFTGGAVTVQLDFTGSAIRERGINGPYRIERLTILSEGGDVTDYRSVAHLTQAYQSNQFSQPLVTLTGALSDYGTDLNGNGRYDLLTTRFGISVLKDGVVFINARLVDKNGKEIEWVTSNTPMTAGADQNIELNFSGQLIGGNGVSGPYEIRDLNLYSSLDPGMNVFRDLAGKTSAYPVSAFEGGGGNLFNDVPADSWAFGYINAIRDAGITQGCGNSNYCPKDPVTREQMAAFLVRAIEGDPAANYCGGNPPFNDVSPGAWSCGHIKRLVELKITLGCGGGNYCPYRQVTREQMAVFIVRALEGDPAENYCGGVAPFVDVSPSSWSCGHIKRLVELGITQGFPGNEYRPNADVNREQMAAFLARAFLEMQ